MDLRPALHKVWSELTHLIKRLGSSFFKKLIKLNRSDLSLLKSLISLIGRPIYIYMYIYLYYLLIPIYTYIIFWVQLIFFFKPANFDYTLLLHNFHSYNQVRL